MIINVSGFGYSGSGAVIDLLKEFEDIQVLDMELNILYVPDGIRDLEYHLCEDHYRFMSSDIAISRFIKRMDAISENFDKKDRKRFMEIAKNYIDSLVQVTWNGYSIIDRSEYSHLKRNLRIKLPDLISTILSKIHIRMPIKDPVRQMYLSIEPSNFLESTKTFFSNILDFIGYNQSNTIVVDQMLASDNNYHCIKYFDEIKIINVLRDPRDVYLLLKAELPNTGKAIPMFIPTDSVENFINYYKLLVNPDPRTKDYTLIVQFEDLIYKYQNTIEKIKSFLSESNHTNPKKYFNPDISINNTQLFYKYPEYKEDIEKIETELMDYLYPFDNFKRIKHTPIAF